MSFHLHQTSSKQQPLLLTPSLHNSHRTSTFTIRPPKMPSQHIHPHSPMGLPSNTPHLAINKEAIKPSEHPLEPHFPTPDVHCLYPQQPSSFNTSLTLGSTPQPLP
ncbi:hypothetical protein V6N13_114343 [Hibiscus sabdariffa]